MKTTNRIVTSIMFLFVSIFLLSCSKNLSREKAEVLIIKKFNLPRTETMQIKKTYYVKNYSLGTGFCPVGIYSGSSENMYSNYKQLIEGLQSNGMVLVKEDKRIENSICWIWADVSLTDEGKKYLVNESDKQYELKTCEIVFGEITGIQIQEQFKVAEVNYTLIRKNITPFGSNISKEHETRSASFSLFDDGWRIN